MVNKRIIYTVGGLLVLALLIFTIPKYFAGNVTASTHMTSDIEKIEIIHFHGTHQCVSCKTVGAYAEETVNTYFQDELKSGKISFQHLNAELPENYDMAAQYGVKSASLWIGTYYKDGSFAKEENTNVWYKLDNKEDYMNYLKGVIENKLLGK